MTNENYAVISAIRAFKNEPEIYKTVMKKLIDEDANSNIIVLLLNPELTEHIIEPGKYSEALEYVMNTYQQERSLIVTEMRLRAYEQRVQGPIEEAKVTSVPTMEAIDLNSGIDLAGKDARVSAQTFVDDIENLNKGDGKANERGDVVEPVETAEETAKKAADEIASSLDESERQKVEGAANEFADSQDLQKANVEVPSVSVLGDAPAQTLKPEEPTVEPEPETVPTETEEPTAGDLTPKEELDSELHEVKGVRETTSFFQRHKKGILIATGLAMVALTSVAFPTLIIPSLMHANSTLALHAPFAGIKTVLHGLNTVLGKVIGATFNNGLWTTASGVAINATAASTGLATAIATYGVWGVFGKGFVNSIKRMFKAVDMESPKKPKKEDKEIVDAEFEPIQEPEVIETPKEEETKEDVPTTPAPTAPVESILVEPTAQESAPAPVETAEETHEEPKQPSDEVTPVVDEPDEPKEVKDSGRFGDVSDDDFQNLLKELQRQKDAKEQAERLAAQSAEEFVAETMEKGKGL